MTFSKWKTNKMTEENFDEVFQLDRFMVESKNFKNNKPFKFMFVENIFKPDFYQKLHDGYPDEENDMLQSTQFSKNTLYRGWANLDDVTNNENAESIEDPKLNQQWNKLYRYLSSDEFIRKLREFSGVPVNKLKSFRFGLMKKGGFQMAHTHNDGPSTLILFFYFSKGWQKGDPGGTFLASEEDESKMFFEPYNLDNTMSILQDGPCSTHGVRYIVKDVSRKMLQIYYESYSEEEGWSGKGHEKPTEGKFEL
jgi:hypothetical protein